MFQKIISEDAIELVEKFLFSKKTIGVLQYKCIDSYLQIENFSVHKDYRNKGYGRALIDELKPDIFVCGHSHILKVVRDTKRDMLVMNPGAAGIQGFHVVRTALRFRIDNGQIHSLELFELDR
jgi:predicted phosphodiesterase